MSSLAVRVLQIVQSGLVWGFVMIVLPPSVETSWLAVALYVLLALGFFVTAYRSWTCWLEVGEHGVTWRGVFSSGHLEWVEIATVTWVKPGLGAGNFDFVTKAPEFRLLGLFPGPVGPVRCAALLPKQKLAVLDRALAEGCARASIPYAPP